MKIQLDEYNHVIEQHNTEAGRFYTKDGKCPLPSVTSLLSTPEKEEGLERWRKMNPDWFYTNKIALDRGTAVHEAIEHYLLTEGEINIKSQYKALMPPLIAVMDSIVDTVHGVELMMHNEEIGAAGTADLICTLKDGRTVIGDYKTSEAQKDTKWMKDYFIQTLTYARMYELEIGRKIDGCMILNVYEKPKPSCRPIIVEASKSAQDKALAFIKKQSDEIRG